jgi:formate/nitrite transporter FocA (FNT family)
MTTAVKFARENRLLPLLWAVPVFILAGFYHSIADSFYYLMYLVSTGFTYISPINYLVVILGNFIGCNLWRIRFKE